MKQLFLMIVAFTMLTCTCVVAQDTTMRKKMKIHKMSQAKDHIMMKDNKVWVIKKGMRSEMKETMTLSNGTMVMTDGTVKTKDGKTTMMKNGSSIDMMGKMMPMKMKKSGDGTMKKRHDSTMRKDTIKRY